MDKLQLDKQNMGLRIRKAREDRGYTREELSELIGISSNALANIERGQSGTQLEYFVRICKLLGLSADFALFGETVERPTVQRIMELLGYQDERHLEAIERSIRAMLDVMQ